MKEFLQQSIELNKNRFKHKITHQIYFLDTRKCNLNYYVCIFDTLLSLLINTISKLIILRMKYYNRRINGNFRQLLQAVFSRPHSDRSQSLYFTSHLSECYTSRIPGKLCPNSPLLSGCFSQSSPFLSGKCVQFYLPNPKFPFKVLLSYSENFGPNSPLKSEKSVQMVKPPPTPP